ncbi:MAG: hypothetical protein N2C14_32990 [Planctomycetales bacterium]
MTHLFWAVVALFLGFAFVAMEVFLPSGGVLGFLAFTALATSLVFAFLYDPMAGALFLAGMLLGLPVVIVLALKWFPYTPIGRRVILGAPGSDDDDENLEADARQALIGKTGTAKSMMLPSGAVLLDGRSMDAVSEGMPIEAGQMVRVTDVRGNRIVVRLIDEEEVFETASETQGDDELARPIDSLGGDPFEEPLA